jgi:hypothetical protein
MHVALMNHFKQQGFDYYDFLGGDSQYKRSLSDVEVKFFNISAYINNKKGVLLYYLVVFRRYLNELCHSIQDWHKGIAKLL